MFGKGSFPEGATLGIYSPLGKLVQVMTLKDQQTNFDLRGSSKGIYILKVTKGDQELGYSKLIIE